MNNIPNILEEKGWTKYRLWQALGGSHSDRVLVYQRLKDPTKPIPPGTQWETIKRVADVLGVSTDELEANGNEPE